MEIVLICVLVFGTIFTYSLLQEPFGKLVQKQRYKTFLKQEDYYRNIISAHLPFMGHVDSSGIYLSWDNFLQGIHRSADNSNVGLHEMAHALTYVNFIVKTEEDKHFKREFKNFSKVARPIFQSMQQGNRTLL